VNGLEAVADAIMKFEGWQPGTKSYRNRNPGNLEDGLGNYKVFSSFVEGYSALLSDLEDKFLGHTRTGLGPDSTILQLMMKYAPPADNNPTQAYTDFICGWCTKALGKTIVTTTPLKEIWSVD
jgi:hypothetical protein